MDDSNFDSIRKNLNIISVLILLLAYSNAEISHLKFLGIDLTLEGTKFYTGLYIIYGYFIWRYLTKLKFKSGFLHGFDIWYLEGVDGVKKHYNLKSLKSLFVNERPELQKEIDSGISSPVSLKVIRFNPKERRKIKLSQTFYKRLSEEERQQNVHQNFNIEIDLNLSRFFLFRKFFWYCVKHDKFGDYLFPLLLCIANLSFFVFSTQWQGGFNHIF